MIGVLATICCAYDVACQAVKLHSISLKDMERNRGSGDEDGILVDGGLMGEP